MRAIVNALLLVVLAVSVFAHEGEDHEHFWDSPEARREMLIQTGAIAGVGIIAAAYLLIRRRMGK